MSLLPTEHLTIVLCPDQIGIVRRPSGLRRGQRSQLELPVVKDNTGWQQTLDALAYWLTSEKVTAASATVTVSNSWARFALVPWSAAVGSEAEEYSLARACLESGYGDLTGWTVAPGPSRYGQSRIVCALETAFLDRLHAILREHKIACRSLHPYFVLASRQAQASLSAPAGMLAVAESGTVVLASTRQGRWHSLRSVRCTPSPEALTQLLERETLLQGFSETPSLAALAPGMVHAKMQSVTLLKPEATPSPAARAIALEAAASRARQLLDFAPKRYQAGKMLGALGFLAALGIAGWSGWSYLQLQQKVATWQAENQKLHRTEMQPRAVSTPEEQERMKAELRFASRVIEKLDTPWDALFGAVESAFNDQVTLLSVEPDTERREVRLFAEAKDMEAMLDYVQQVRESPVLKNGYLVDHQINQQDPQRPVRFTVMANWAAQLPGEARRDEPAAHAEGIKP